MGHHFWALHAGTAGNGWQFGISVNKPDNATDTTVYTTILGVRKFQPPVSPHTVDAMPT